MFYANTIKIVRSKFPVVAPVKSEITQGPAHLLWMCDQIESFDERSLDMAFKAARWIGWILAALESTPELYWTNTVSRQLVKLDVAQDHDRPTYMRGTGLLQLIRRIGHGVYTINEYLKRVYS